MQTATAKYIFNEAAMRRGRYWHWFKTPFLVFLFPAIGLIMVALGFWLHWKNSESPTAWILPVVGAYFIFRYWIIGLRFERNIRAHPLYGYEMKCVVDHDGSTTFSPDGESRSGWSHLHAIYVTPEGFLIYPQKEIWVWIPRSAFGCEEEAAFAEDVMMRQPVTKKL